MLIYVFMVGGGAFQRVQSYNSYCKHKYYQPYGVLYYAFYRASKTKKTLIFT